ncbi:MAG: SDR family NAD(P)-dependent oxidoreductase, partial [Oxalobacteraceae bacterium]
MCYRARPTAAARQMRSHDRRLGTRSAARIEGSTMGKLQNKVAIVTGGSSGIGRAIANRFAAEGAFVYVVGRREKELAETVAEIGASAAPIRADLARTDDIEA